MDEERTSPETAVLTEDMPAPELPAVLPELVPEPEVIPSPEVTPESEPESISEAPAEEIPQKISLFRRILRTALYRILPATLLAVAVTVYATLAVTSLTETEFTVTQFLKTALGEFTGGAEYVRFTETADMEENTVTLPPEFSPETELSAELPPETLAEPSPAEFVPDFSLYRLDMSSAAANAFGLVNETPYDVDLNALSEAERTIPPYRELAETYGSSAPVVLILHTHATESYADTSADDFRSQDDSRNVTAVGKVIADRLTENGIPVLHCTEKFDYPDFNMAYYNAALAIKRYIADYPSISYILDIHRDSILSGDGWVSPVTELNGESTAQMMFVVGTDHGGSGHTGWRDNLALAARLQKSLYGECPTLMRDLNLRSASFNEQYTPGSLLVEIGSCASTLEEVKNAAERFADHLTKEIVG